MVEVVALVLQLYVVEPLAIKTALLPEQREVADAETVTVCVGLFNKMDTLLLLSLAVARSGFPSILKSAVTIPKGLLPVAKFASKLKLPVPVQSNTDA